MKLSCAASTAPVDVPVVDTANSALAGIPNRTSLPSIIAPAACAAIPRGLDSAQVTRASMPPKRVPITDSTVRP
ncbi:Uncharacterised protein [Mycobacteroides abscessus subsp. abscessus]|nr:Uncharacterised protein [Mycobacteroides abscessus subsp. abscessus]